MRSIVLFNNVAADTAATSEYVEFTQRAEWMLTITKAGTDGDPNIIIEYSVENTAPTVWTPLQNPETLLYVFPIDEDEVSIIDDRLQGFYYRIRLEPNGTTTGTIKADLGYKTYP